MKSALVSPICPPSMAAYEQYREALCFELSGRCFQLTLESARRYALHFLDSQMLCWGAQGQPMRWDAYRCLKLDDDAYLIHVDFDGDTPAPCAAFIIDKCARRLIAAVPSSGGREESRLITGTICEAGYPALDSAVAPSADFAGHSILWRLGSGCAALHVFPDVSSVRISYTDPWEPVLDAACGAVCPAAVYRLREDRYAVFIRGGAKGGQMGEQLMLINTNTVRCIGWCKPAGSAKGALFSGAGMFIRPEAFQQKSVSEVTR